MEPIARQVVEFDHDVTEVTGWPVEVDFSEKHPILWVQAADEESEQYGATVKNTTPLRRLMHLAGRSPRGHEDNGKWLLEHGKQAEVQAFFEEFKGSHEATIFRITDEDELFAIVSQRWQRNDIEAVLPIIEEILPGYKCTYDPSTGLDGGSATIVLDTMDMITPNIHVQMGRKDGLHSLRVQNGAEIISCTNALVAEVSNNLKFYLTPNKMFFLKQRHCSKVIDDEWLRMVVTEAYNNATFLQAALEDSKEWGLELPEVRQILTFYWSVGRLSQRSVRNIYAAYLDEDISQKPNTVYGLAMAMSWFGTHEKDVSDGVQERTRTLAGELALVADQVDKFYDEVVMPRVKDIETDVFEGLYK